MRYNGQRSSAILPATQILLGKSKCTIAEAAREMGGGSFTLCERDNGYGKTPTVYMLSSAGAPYQKIGDVFDAHHDHSGRPYGPSKVLGTVLYSVLNDEVDITEVVTAKGFEFDATFKAPLFVYK